MYENLTGIATVSHDKKGFWIEIERKPLHIPSASLGKTPLRFADRNTGFPGSGDPRVDNTAILFNGNDPKRPDFFSMGFCQYRRLD